MTQGPVVSGRGVGIITGVGIGVTNGVGVTIGVGSGVRLGLGVKVGLGRYDGEGEGSSAVVNTLYPLIDEFPAASRVWIQ